MPGPFPGMDPHLESPQGWRSVHAQLIAAINVELNSVLPPSFVSTIEARVYRALPSSLYPDVSGVERTGPPGGVSVTAAPVADAPLIVTLLDEEVHERYIEVRAARSDERVVAVIEVLSPTNKSREAYGRDSYIKRRDSLLWSGTHLLEIDLLRAGAPTVAAPPESIAEQAKDGWDYLACLHRAGAGRQFDVWPVALRSRLPRVSLPLTPDYPDVVLDLQDCLSRVYDAGAFARLVDYRREPVPPLSPDDAAWADALLKTKGLR